MSNQDIKLNLIINFKKQFFLLFQRLEDLLLECEGDLDQLIQKSEGMTAADPKMGMPIELTTLQAQYIELQAQVGAQF